MNTRLQQSTSDSRFFLSILQEILLILSKNQVDMHEF